MDTQMTKDLFTENGFDFYTMHPYGPELNLVNDGAGGQTTLDSILDALSDKPLVFTEWGGLFVHENASLFARFLNYMLDAWANRDGGRVLAGCCYWLWADMYEFGRGEPACFHGVLREGLVDIRRRPYGNLDVFTRMLHGMGRGGYRRPSMELARLSMAAEGLLPLAVWQNVDCEAQRELYKRLLAESTPQAGFHHKKTRCLPHGPALPEDCSRIGDLPVDLRRGPPLVVARNMDIPVGLRVSRIFCLGNVSMPAGYPICGARGDPVAEYVLRYDDGGEARVPLRNGMEITTVFGSMGPSRVEPLASGVERVMRYGYDLNWEHYIVNLFTMDADPSRVLASIGVRVFRPEYRLLLYGVTVKKILRMREEAL